MYTKFFEAYLIVSIYICSLNNKKITFTWQQQQICAQA
jgi:hypothetical protein